MECLHHQKGEIHIDWARYREAFLRIDKGDEPYWILFNFERSSGLLQVEARRSDWEQRARSVYSTPCLEDIIFHAFALVPNSQTTFSLRILYIDGKDTSKLSINTKMINSPKVLSTLNSDAFCRAQTFGIALIQGNMMTIPSGAVS